MSKIKKKNKWNCQFVWYYEEYFHFNSRIFAQFFWNFFFSHIETGSRNFFWKKHQLQVKNMLRQRMLNSSNIMDLLVWYMWSDASYFYLFCNFIYFSLTWLFLWLSLIFIFLWKLIGCSKLHKLSLYTGNQLVYTKINICGIKVKNLEYTQ